METIYQKLGAVMADVKAVDKAQKNAAQGFMFRGIDDMMNALHGLFAKHGIIVVPKELEHHQESYTYKNSKGYDAIQFRSFVHMQFTFASVEDGSSVTADGWGEAADNGDKGYNKCKSIALKYVLMQMFLIPTKDMADPEKETPEDVVAEDETLQMLLSDIRNAQTHEALMSIYNEYPQYRDTTRFMQALSNRKKMLK